MFSLLLKRLFKFIFPKVSCKNNDRKHVDWLGLVNVLQLHWERNASNLAGSYTAFTATLANFRPSAAVFTAAIDLFFKYRCAILEF